MKIKYILIKIDSMDLKLFWQPRNQCQCQCHLSKNRCAPIQCKPSIPNEHMNNLYMEVEKFSKCENILTIEEYKVVKRKQTIPTDIPDGVWW